MSLQDFWLSVRTGTSFLAPRATADSPKLDANKIAQTLRSAVIWLTPKSVEGFEAADFPFLPESERTQLADLVAQFHAIASIVPPTEPATREQIDQALPFFLGIIKMLEFDRYGDAEAYRIGKKIEQAIDNYRPQELAELRFNTGRDHTGDPAIWIWAILEEAAAADDARFFHLTEKMRKLLDTASRAMAPDLWPYIRFRTVSEQAEIMEAQAS
jgi:hypothetical protein